MTPDEPAAIRDRASAIQTALDSAGLAATVWIETDDADDERPGHIIGITATTEHGDVSLAYRTAWRQWWGSAADEDQASQADLDPDEDPREIAAWVSWRVLSARIDAIGEALDSAGIRASIDIDEPGGDPEEPEPICLTIHTGGIELSWDWEHRWHRTDGAEWIGEVAETVLPDEATGAQVAAYIRGELAREAAGEPPALTR